MTAKDATVGLAAGLIFGVGLLLSGMTQPQKVVAFLDIGGAWDPALGFVMVGAIGVNAVAWWWSRGMPSPWLDTAWDLPDTTRIDLRLLAGASLFGVGWGLSGFCPAPAIVSLGGVGSSAVVFVPSMLVGMGGFRVWAWWSMRPTVPAPASS